MAANCVLKPLTFTRLRVPEPRRPLVDHSYCAGIAAPGSRWVNTTTPAPWLSIRCSRFLHIWADPAMRAVPQSPARHSFRIALPLRWIQHRAHTLRERPHPPEALLVALRLPA